MGKVATNGAGDESAGDRDARPEDQGAGVQSRSVTDGAPGRSERDEGGPRGDRAVGSDPSGQAGASGASTPMQIRGSDVNAPAARVDKPRSPPTCSTNGGREVSGDRMFAPMRRSAAYR